MNVNIENIQKDITDFDNIISIFEENFNLFYMEANFNIKYWVTPIANYFFKIIEEEKRENFILLERIKELGEVLNFIKTSYKKIGDKSLYVDLNKKDDILNILENFSVDINGYNLLNFEYFEHIRERVISQKIKMENVLNNMSKYINVISEKYLIVEYIEKNIAKKLSSISLPMIQEYTSEEHAFGEMDSMYIYINRLMESKKKLITYKNSEEKNLQDLKKLLIQITENYRTSNTETIEYIINDIIFNIQKIINNHHNNIELINKSIERGNNALKVGNSVLNGVGFYEW